MTVCRELRVGRNRFASGWMTLAVETTTPTVTLQARDVIAGRYEVRSLIAEGGMGAIYLGRQIGLDRKVAIKTLRPRLSGRADLVKRFRRESRAAQRLTHPNTVRVYDFGETESGLLYLVMEYLEGRTLDAVLHQMGKMASSIVIHIGRQVLKSLVEAHAHNIVHRDIKPSNLMLCRQLGELNLVKVLDFGLAHIIPRAKSVENLAESTMGTPHYMSPEQVAVQPLDGRSDLYSLGLTLFELAVGRPAYDGESAYEVAMRHLSPTPLELPQELEGTRLGKVIAKATEKDLEERYQSAEEMLTALSGVDPTKTDEAMAVLDLLQSDDLLPTRTSGPHDAVQDQLATEDFTRLVLDDGGKRYRWRVILVATLLVVVTSTMLGVVLRPRQRDDDQAASAASTTDLAALDAPTRILEDLAGVPVELRREGLEGSGLRVVVGGPPHEIEFVVNSQPSGAGVFIDGVSICKTPCDTTMPGRQEPATLTVALDGYEPTVEQVDLSRAVTLPVLLSPLPRELERRRSAENGTSSSRSHNSEHESESATGETGDAESEAGTNGATGTPVRRRAIPIDF